MGWGVGGAILTLEKDGKEAGGEDARALGQTPSPRSESELAVRTAPRRPKTHQTVLGDGVPSRRPVPVASSPTPPAPGEPSGNIHIQIADPGSTQARAVGGARGHRGRPSRSHGRRPTSRKLASVKFAGGSCQQSSTKLWGACVLLIFSFPIYTPMSGSALCSPSCVF